MYRAAAILAIASLASALYDSGDAVIQLDDKNFDKSTKTGECVAWRLAGADGASASTRACVRSGARARNRRCYRPRRLCATLPT